FGLHRVADLLVPLRDRTLGDRLAELRHDYIHRYGYPLAISNTFERMKDERGRTTLPEWSRPFAACGRQATGRTAVKGRGIELSREAWGHPSSLILHPSSLILHPSSFVCLPLLFDLMHELAAHHGDQWFDVLYLPRRHRQVVAVEHQEIGVLSGREGAQIGFLEHDERVRPGVRDEGLLARDRLAVHLAPADHLARDRQAQGVERIRRGDRGGVRAQSPQDPAVLHAAEGRHVPGLVA